MTTFPPLPSSQQATSSLSIRAAKAKTFSRGYLFLSPSSRSCAELASRRCQGSRLVILRVISIKYSFGYCSQFGSSLEFRISIKTYQFNRCEGGAVVRTGRTGDRRDVFHCSAKIYDLS